MGTIFLVIGKRAKRVRRYLLMSMESRDIRTSVSNTHARMSVLRMNSKAKNRKTF